MQQVSSPMNSKQHLQALELLQMMQVARTEAPQQLGCDRWPVGTVQKPKQLAVLIVF